MNNVEIHNEITKLSIAVERAHILVDDVIESYLDQDISIYSDAWRLLGIYQKNALVKTQIAVEILDSTEEKISSLLSEFEKLIKQEKSA